MRKSSALAELFGNRSLDFLMGAHDALSGRIAQDTGFPGVWISGLGLSAASGVRDANELSWTQVVERAELIANRLRIPCLVDIDSGFGDFNNVRLVAQRLARGDVGGACIEDKLFPKTNSFIGDGQALASPMEFCGRLRAAKDVAGEDLHLVARCEALVAGRPLAEALDRCHLYADAGADAILIHSKKTSAAEVVEFMAAWDGHAPVAVVPTKYSRVDPGVFERAGISVAIWANQSLRAAITAMRRLSRALYEQRTMRDLESEVAELSEVFELTDDEELRQAKERYSVFMAAGDGRRSGAVAESPTSAVDQVYRSREAWRRQRAGTAGRDPHEDFLGYLRTAVPFYRGTTGSLPLVERSLYQMRGELFRSDTVPAAHQVTSSGTTGAPLTIPVSEASWYAVNHHFFRQIRDLAGLPDNAFRPAEVAVVFVSNKPGRGSFVQPLPECDDGLYVRLRLGSGAVAKFSELAGPILYGKPTYLLDLRAELIRRGADRAPWSPRLVLVSGEALYPDDRRRIRDFFGAPVMDALTSTEGGLVAATAPDGATYQVFGDNVRLEVLDRDGETSPSGRGELVLTNLVYRATVVARYRTGDHAELRTAADGSQCLTALPAREPESVPIGGQHLASRELTQRLGSVPGLGDFQIVVGDPGRTVVRWVPDVLCSDPPGVDGALHAAFSDLAPGAEVVLRQHERITPLGGKKRRILREDTVVARSASGGSDAP
ncbi:MAG TPA: isocitrate lyase/phosphoenolpyruvate mutase family protein [Mycobacteriales bacterium]|nr:isocitrate lyase/phosphoenolpyruvate mutase family protein [Mycobacteriales bacterium]